MGNRCERSMESVKRYRIGAAVRRPKTGPRDSNVPVRQIVVAKLHDSAQTGGNVIRGPAFPNASNQPVERPQQPPIDRLKGAHGRRGAWLPAFCIQREKVVAITKAVEKNP